MLHPLPVVCIAFCISPRQSGMTNPIPDFQFQVKFNCVASPVINNHRLVDKSDTAEDPMQDALVSPTTVGTMGTDLKVSSTDVVKSTVGIIKKSADTQQKASKRKLSFKVNEKDEIEEEVHTYSFPSNVDDNDVWWMDDELDKLLTEAMMVADYYTRKRKDWQNKIKKVMKCVAASTKKKEGEQETEKVKGSDLDFVVDSDARGLELYIHPIFQKNREKAVRGVVKVQEEYNASEKKKGKVDQELRLKVLRAQSLKLTQLARSMAITMADGDTRAAAKEEETPSNALIPTEVKLGPMGGGDDEHSVNSADLLSASEELTLADQPVQRMPRPRAKSIMRSFSPKRTPVGGCKLKAIPSSQDSLF